MNTNRLVLLGTALIFSGKAWAQFEGTVRIPPVDAEPLVNLASTEEDPPIYKPRYREKEGLTVIKKTSQVWLSVDNGSGTAASPRKWYVSFLARAPLDTYVSESSIVQVFRLPGNDKHPAFPSDEIHLADKPFNFDNRDRTNPQPFQLWVYPDPGPEMKKGIYAFKSVSEPGVQPLLWWGIGDAKSWNEGSPEQIEKNLGIFLIGGQSKSPPAAPVQMATKFGDEGHGALRDESLLEAP